MSSIRIKSIDNTIEEKILTGLIVSDKICRDSIKLIKKDAFQNPYSWIVAKWISNYYKEYKKSPKTTIQDIYNVEKSNLKPEESEFIGSFLSKLSESFEKEEKFNEDYILDQSINYYKKRALKNISEKIDSCLDLDKLVDAEKALQSYKEIRRDSTKFLDPFSDDEIKKFFEDEQNDTNKMFRLPGALGELIGDFERGTFIGVMGPAKRGKSFWLMEIALRAFFERYKVLFVSLEMNSFKMKRRLLKRITAFGDETKDHIYPCFDCWKNQMNVCNKPVRTNNIKLRDEEGNKPKEFNPSAEYKTCTVCRGKRDYIPERWFTIIRRPRRTLNNTRKNVQGLRHQFGENFKLVCYSKFSANISDIKADIELLEQDENFIPDVIVVDYADILAPEDSRIIGRDRYDDTWKMFGNLADTRKALVITASQTNRQSFDKKNVTATDASEDIRKIANVDMMIGLNQTPDEKKDGVMRVSVAAGRDDDFNQLKTCIVLQNLALGQVCLDSELDIESKK
jgi:replicative DNA helicase